MAEEALAGGADPDVAARLDRIEALLARLTAGLPDILTPAIRRAACDDWFTAGELWRVAVAQAMASATTGDPRPELIEALESEGIRSAHGLGRWISSREGRGFERGGIERGGVLWRVAR